MKYLVVAMLFAIACSVPASASSIGLGSWYEFGFDPNHSLDSGTAGCQPADPSGVPCRTGISSQFLGASPWTFTATSPVQFTITDAYLPGDYFDVLDGGTLVGSTPSVSLRGPGCGLDPSICVVTAGISHASFLLLPGPHSITVNVHPAQLLGEGFFRIDAVPEPSTLGFGFASFILIGVYRRLGSRPPDIQR